MLIKEAGFLYRLSTKYLDYQHLRNQHTASQHQLGTRDPFVPPLNNVANNAGYIVLKDSKFIAFYSNNLFQTPPEPMLQGTEARAISCVHGLARISRWTGTEVLNQTDFFTFSNCCI
jgi:hypothetical protein